VPEASVEEIERLVGQLESDSYAERVGAARRLQWLLGSPPLVTPIMVRLKQRMLTSSLSAYARLWLEPIAEKARGAWLASDPRSWDLPAVSDEQLGRWIDDLAGQVSREMAEQPGIHKIAQRELRDLLARDSEVSRVKAALEGKLCDAGIDQEGAQRLREILDLTRPAMVAEFWMNRQQRGTQHLLVGVPSRGQLAERPSHFDRIDDESAHCASGQNLSPGDYPVGVAIPHPNLRLDGAAFFHLVNLPTPRRRMGYAYDQRRENALRLAEISRRTVDLFLQRKVHLTEPELIMLLQLDAEVMSGFAAKMLLATDDRPLPREGIERPGGRPTHHGMLSGALAAQGTGAAIPGLLEAIEKQRVLPPTPQALYRLDWIAALAIAARDGWPEVDAWLAGVVERNDPLVQGRPSPPEFGATAAAILLQRDGQNASAFALEATDDPLLEQFGVRGYRFVSSDAPGVVLQWWSKQKGREARG